MSGRRRSPSDRYHRGVTERGLATGDRATACPFVAFADDRDARSDQADHRHRCYAEARPAPRALAHQDAYCLSTQFVACPTFQDWARREAARMEPAQRPSGTLSDVPGDSSPRPPASVAGRDRDAPEAADADIADRGAADRAAAADVHEPPPRNREAERDAPLDPWAAASEADDLALPPPRRTRRDWAAPPPWAAGAAGAAGASAAAGAGPVETDAAAEGRIGRGDRAEPLQGEQAADRDRGAPRAPEAEPDAAPGRRRADGETPAFLAERSRDAGDRRRHADDEQAAFAAAGGAAYLDDDETDESQRRFAVGHRSAEHLDGPSWERPRRSEAYPSLRSPVSVRMPGLSPLILGAGLLVVAALALFFVLPGLLDLGGAGGGTGASSPTPSVAASASVAPTPTPAPTPFVYTVRHGDTLSKIAKRFGLTIDQIVQANAALIKDPNKIAEGQQLNIPTPPPSDVPAGSASPAPSPSG